MGNVVSALAFGAFGLRAPQLLSLAPPHLRKAMAVWALAVLGVARLPSPRREALESAAIVGVPAGSLALLGAALLSWARGTRGGGGGGGGGGGRGGLVLLLSLPLTFGVLPAVAAPHASTRRGAAPHASSTTASIAAALLLLGLGRAAAQQLAHAPGQG